MVPWSATGTFAFEADRKLGILVCPASPRPSVRCALRRPDPPVVCPGFGLDRCDDAEDEMIGRLDLTGHREKLGPEGLWCTMTTKNLAPGNPLARSPPAIKAIMDELMDLRDHNVWDESNPVEASEVTSMEPETHIVRVFAIVGIKHYENKDAQKYKDRIVVSGDKVKTATGQWAVFQEIGTGG